MCGGDATFLSNYFDHLLKMALEWVKDARFCDVAAAVASSCCNSAHVSAPRQLTQRPSPPCTQRRSTARNSHVMPELSQTLAAD